jgi:hypothetical protein
MTRTESKRSTAATADIGEAQARADRAEIRRLVRMSDAERESYFIESNRNMLRMLADAQRAR